MVAARPRLAESATPDDAADALAIAIWVANTERAGRQRRTAAVHGTVAADRARSPAARHRYERAVREALAPSGPAKRSAPAGRDDRVSGAPRVIASRRGRGRRRRGGFARHRGRRDRLPGVRGAGGPRHRAPGRPAQAPHLPPRPRGPAGAVRLPDARGARVLQPAPHGDRRRAQGRAGHRRLPAHRRPPARDPPAGPGGAGRRSRGSARSSPSGSSSSSRRRSRRPAWRRRARRLAGSTAARARSWPRSRPSATPWARRARRRGGAGDTGRRDDPRGAGQGGAPSLAREWADVGDAAGNELSSQCARQHPPIDESRGVSRMLALVLMNVVNTALVRPTLRNDRTSVRIARGTC